MQTERVHWGYVCSGFTTLLLAAYLDNIRGVLLPVISKDLGIPYAKVGLFLVAGQLAAILTTLGIIPLVNRCGEKVVTFIILAITIFSGVIAVWVSSYGMLLLLAAFIGISISMLGAICNILVIEGSTSSSNARLLSGLHSMYGIGSIFGPLFVSIGLQLGLSWQSFFSVASFSALAFSIIISKILPYERRAVAEHVQSAKINGIELVIILLFAAYVAFEVLASMWIPTFLVEAQGLPLGQAALYQAGFFSVMTLTRLLSIFIVSSKREPIILFSSLTAAALFFLAGMYFNPICFAFFGILGPFFPVLLGRVSTNFPRKWRSITIWLLVAIQLTLALSNTVMGHLVDAVGMRIAFITPLLFFLIAILLLVKYLRWENKQSKKVPILGT